jgi:altronate dehydratase large subunit
VRFAGYLRNNGAIGVRNHILVFPTVVCAAFVAQKISEAVPGTVYVTHPHGCGHLGAEREHMIRTMAGFCANPNVGGVLLVGLGCEQLTPEVLALELERSGQRFEIVNIQQEGGTTAAIAKGREAAARLIEAASQEPRSSFDISRLVVGMKCGGSDTLSGLTANPAVGVASDLLVAEGATVIITEVPEMIGAEHVLARRAVDEEVRERIFQVVGEMEAAILKTGVDVRGTEPSPGNIQGGLTTLEEKSLGAVLKGGESSIRQVVRYAEKPSQKGLVIMDGPALDAVCVTGMLAAGTQVIVFTTGRGSPLGSAIAPVIKVASNSALYRTMRDNMDLNAGAILDEDVSLAEIGQRIFEEILDVASGEQTRGELLGHNEFAIHSIGPAV